MKNPRAVLAIPAIPAMFASISDDEPVAANMSVDAPSTSPPPIPGGCVHSGQLDRPSDLPSPRPSPCGLGGV